MRLPIKKDICILLFCGTLYAANRIWVKQTNSFFLHCYFNDLIAGVAFPCYVNFLLTIKKRRILKLSSLLVLIIVAGLFWEFVAPLFVPYATTDVVDLVAYCSGTMIYWGIERVCRHYNRLPE